jgi:hypothetical protein
VDEIGGMQPEDVDAQDFAGILSVDHLGDTLALLLC